MDARPVRVPIPVDLDWNTRGIEGTIAMQMTWFITGSSRGFGREIAKAALKRGDRVVATARKSDQLDDLLKEYGEQVLTFALDVTDSAAANRAIDAAINSFGSLDIVVNNAGYADSAPIEEMSEASFRDQIETNLFGVVNVTKAALPIFHQQRSGHFLQILINRRPSRWLAGIGRVPDSKVCGRRVLRGPQRGGEAARHQSDDRRTRRFQDRLGRLVDAHLHRGPRL